MDFLGTPGHPDKVAKIHYLIPMISATNLKKLLCFIILQIFYVNFSHQSGEMMTMRLFTPTNIVDPTGCHIDD